MMEFDSGAVTVGCVINTDSLGQWFLRYLPSSPIRINAPTFSRLSQMLGKFGTRDRWWITHVTVRFADTNNTRQQDFGTWKVYCVCNVTFHAEFKYEIRIFPSLTVIVQWHFLLSIFRNFRYFLQWFFYTWTNILNGFEQRVVTDNLPLSNH